MRSTAAGDAHLQLVGYQHPSRAYREGGLARSAAEKDVDDSQLESSLSGSGLAPSGDAVRRSRPVRYQRSTSGRHRAVRTTNEDDAESSDQLTELQAAGRDRPEHVDDDEEYIDNSDIEITTRSYYQTTALRPF